MTGYNADPARPEQNAWDLSWATGDAEEVNSIATRFVALRPSAKGLIWNAAGNGADVSALVDQAQLAFEYVPTPELVLVQAIDNDIRCDGTDEANVPAFGAHLADALATITAQSPTAKIVVFGYLGFPTPELIEQLVARTPELKAELIGDGPCDPYDSSGNLVPARFEYLRDVVRGYEVEQARVCATVPTCVTDGGLSAQFPESVDKHANDGHLNSLGHATTAELLWPVVADALGV